jgi:thymidylate synthase (FAD)
MENNNPWFIEGSSKSRLVTVTPNAEEHIAYIARVTSKDQSNPKISGLLKHCAKHGHWSVFENATMSVEVITPLAISIQALRHRSFCFQQFSGRYEDQGFMGNYTNGLPTYKDLFYMPEEARVQDTKNRQNSFVAEDNSLTDFMWAEFEFAYKAAITAYNNLLDRGIAKELARFVLPEGVYTRLYITGNVRSFIHYINVRDDQGVAQWEHVELARAVRSVFATQFPTIYDSLFDPQTGSLLYKDKEHDEQIAKLKGEISILHEEIEDLKSIVTTLQSQLSNQ